MPRHWIAAFVSFGVILGCLVVYIYPLGGGRGKIERKRQGALQVAIAQLRSGTTDDDTFRQVMQSMDSEDQFERAFAVAAIGSAFKRLTKDQQEEVLDRLGMVIWKDKDAVRREALLSVGTIGSPAIRILPALVRCLDYSSSEVSYLAARAIGSIGADACVAVPRLEEVLKKKMSRNLIVTELRLSTFNALASLGVCATSAGAAVASYLDDVDENIRMSAAITLLEIGGDTNKAASVLKELSLTADVGTRRRMFWKLDAVKHGLPIVEEAITNGTRDIDEKVRSTATGIENRMRREKTGS